MPETLIDAHVQLPQRSGGGRFKPLVNRIHLAGRIALQVLVDQQVGIEIGDQGRQLLTARQRLANDRQQLQMLGHVGRCIDVVTDFVGQDLKRIVVQPALGDVLQVHHDALRGQANGGKAVGQPGLGGGLHVKQPERLLQLQVIAPELQGALPLSLPMIQLRICAHGWPPTLGMIMMRKLLWKLTTQSYRRSRHWRAKSKLRQLSFRPGGNCCKS